MQLHCGLQLELFMCKVLSMNLYKKSIIGTWPTWCKNSEEKFTFIVKFFIDFISKMSENLVHFEGSLDELKAKIAAAPGLIVIKFGSTTCMPCKRLNQMLPNIAKENTDVQFLMVDIDDKEDFRNAYEISSVPTVLYYKGNQKLDEIIGLKIPDLKAKIAQYK